MEIRQKTNAKVYLFTKAIHPKLYKKDVYSVAYTQGIYLHLDFANLTLIQNRKKSL